LTKLDFLVIYWFGYPVGSFKIHKEKEIMEQLIFQSSALKMRTKGKMKEIAMVLNFLELKGLLFIVNK